MFGEAIGCIPGEYNIKVDDDVRPVVHPPRSVPSALRDKVKDEIITNKQNGRNWNPKESDRTNAVGKQYGCCNKDD